MPKSQGSPPSMTLNEEFPLEFHDFFPSSNGFLVESTQLYRKVCPSIRPSSVGLLVRDAFFSLDESKLDVEHPMVNSS